VVHTLTPDRSDQPYGKAILPRRGRCGRLVPDAHGAQSARDDAAIDPVAIADEVVRSLIPKETPPLSDVQPILPSDLCDVDPHEVSAVEPDNDEGIERSVFIRPTHDAGRNTIGANHNDSGCKRVKTVVCDSSMNSGRRCRSAQTSSIAATCCNFKQLKMPRPSNENTHLLRRKIICVDPIRITQ